VVQGASKVFNPSLSDRTLAAQRAADPTAAGAEWDAIFRNDIGAFLDDALIDAAIEYGRPLELSPAEGVIYRVFVDAAGGGPDSYTLAIGHMEGDAYVIDLVRGTSGKFDPQSITEEYAALCRQYRVRTVTGDNYARDWVAGAWRKLGFEYLRSPKPKGLIYLEALPVFTRGLARLPDHARLIRELRLLERRKHRSGKDTVDHGRNGHDDHANVVCGVLSLLAPPPFEQPSITAMPVAAGAPRPGVPGGGSFGADAFIAPTIGSLTAPAESAAAPNPTAPAHKNAPVVAKPGHVTDAQRQRVNNDRSLEFKIMTEPSRVAGEPQPSLGNEPWRWPRW